MAEHRAPAVAPPVAAGADSLLPEAIGWRAPRAWFALLLLGFLAAVPAYAALFDAPFYLTQYGRIMIYAIAASALNLLIGYTGLVSFGHALFVALGAYAVGVLDFHGVVGGWIQLSVAIAAALVVALATGLVVLRTRGMGFIMITLAFAQMFFFLGISLKQYGGDDGIRLAGAARLAPFDLADARTLYYLIFATLVAVLFLGWRLVHSRLGHVLRGIRSNERRLLALGYPVLRFKLLAWVLSAMVAAVAGFLLAHLTSYASPSYAAWNLSGELIVIVMLGGIGTVLGPLVGALVLLLLEEYLATWTVHWMAPLGVAIVLVVLLARQGVYGALHAWSTKRERADAAARRARATR
ncbi:MAG: branched-chain amino acid ABC transporter permease [Lautropia sp.]